MSRSRGRIGRISIALFISPMYLAVVVWMGVLTLNWLPEGQADVPTGQRVAYGIIGSLFLLLTVRTATIGVYLRDDHLVIRNVMRSWRLAYDQVERFHDGETSGKSFGRPVAKLTDGRTITVFALNPGLGERPDPTRGVGRMVAELNARLESRKAMQRT
ncbi:MAG: hypothetical protein ACRDPK_03915 [Carbonactinosporaceae bacterium]